MTRTKKSKKTRLPTKLPWKKLLGSRKNKGAAIVVVLLVIGLASPNLRDSIAEALSISNPHKPLSSKVKGPLEEGVWAVVRVVDGDTIIVGDRADRAKQYTVRLIGANTPEVAGPRTQEEPFGPEASEFTKQKIAEAKSVVRIAFDGDQVDKYDRSLAMVYLQMPNGQEVWLNELLIREGLARAQVQYRYSKGAKDAFRRAEAEAQNARRNLWNLPFSRM